MLNVNIIKVSFRILVKGAGSKCDIMDIWGVRVLFNCQQGIWKIRGPKNMLQYVVYIYKAQ